MDKQGHGPGTRIPFFPFFFCLAGSIIGREFPGVLACALSSSPTARSLGRAGEAPPPKEWITAVESHSKATTSINSRFETWERCPVAAGVGDVCFRITIEGKKALSGCKHAAGCIARSAWSRLNLRGPLHWRIFRPGFAWLVGRLDGWMEDRDCLMWGERRGRGRSSTHIYLHRRVPAVYRRLLIDDTSS